MTETLSMRERIARADNLAKRLRDPFWYEGDLTEAAAALEDVSTALSEAYAAGRAAGMQESARLIENHVPCFTNHEGGAQYLVPRRNGDISNLSYAKAIRALIPRPADDTPASPA